MVLGIGGPLLILVHSTFQVGSLNAAVALYSMISWPRSGVVGRFIYAARAPRPARRRRLSLQQLQARAGLDQNPKRARGCTSRRRSRPACMAFEQPELRRRGWLEHLSAPGVLAARASMWIVYWRCVRRAAPSADPAGRGAGSGAPRTWRGATHLARKLVRRYLTAVVRVAQFTAYERLFSLWHVVHIPFVYLLVISAIVHVIAVHAY